MSTSGASSGGGARKRGRLFKVVVVLVAAGALVAVLGWLFVPTIVSSMGPGKTEAALKGLVDGTVRVQKFEVGWSSPTKIGPIEVRDAKGRVMARADVLVKATLWQIAKERWWSASAVDLGTIEISGMVDAERDVAAAPAAPKKTEPKPSGGSGASTAYKGTIRISNFDLSVRDVMPDGSKGPDVGVKGLKGDVNFDYGARTVLAKADLFATPIGPGASSQALFHVKADADVKPSVAGANSTGFEKADVKAEITGAPVALIDGLAGLGGAMVSAIGQTADVRVTASGNQQAAAVHVEIASTGTNGTFDLSLKDGVLTALKPEGGAATNRLTVQSLEFMGLLPQYRAGFAEAAKTVKLTGAPGLEIAIDSLRIPVPADMVSGKSKFDIGAIDLRAASLVGHATVSAMQGQVALQQGGAHGGPGGAGDWHPFAVEPVQFAINAPDLTQGATITAGTKALLDGQSAGNVAIQASAAGLLDDKGHLRAAKGGLADRLDADVRVAGVSTALAQPLLTGLGVPLDLRQDVGPTLDMTVQAQAQGAAGAPGELPPMDINVQVSGANIKLAGAAKVQKNTITGTGDGITLNINSGGPLAGRLVPSLQLSGAGRMQVSIKDLVADLTKLKGDAPLTGLKANIAAKVEDLSVKPAQFEPGAQPIVVQSMTIAAGLAPGAAPKIDLDGNLSHQGQPFGAKAAVALEGMTDGKLPKGGGIDAAFKLGAHGSAALSNVPRSVLGAVPALSAYLADQPANATDLSAQIARAVQAALGQSVTLTTTFTPLAGKEGGTQATVQAATQSRTVTADVAATVTSAAATVSKLALAADINPETVNPVLASQATPGTPPLRIANPFKVNLSATEPIVVPLASKNGALEPDFARAGDASINLTSQGNLTIDNLVFGRDASGQPKVGSITLSDLAAQVKAPLSGLDPSLDPVAKNKKRAAVKATANLAQGGAAGGARLAEFSLDATAAMDGTSPEGTVHLANLDTKGMDALLGRSGLLAGALGDKADIHATAAPQSGSTLITAEIKAPRLQGANIAFVQDKTKTSLTKPATVVWTPDPAFLNAMLAPPAAASGARKSTLTVTQITPITVQLSSLTLAAGATDAAGQATAGPLKPGVFALDAVLTTQSVAMLAADAAPAGGKAAPGTPITMEGLRLAAKSTGSQTPGVDADLSIDRFTGAELTGAGKKSTAHITATNIADARGVPTLASAVYNLQADLNGFPTAIVDQLAKQDGLMVETLGPLINATATGKDVSLKAAQDGPPLSGLVEAKATSARASATIKGNVRDGAFVQSGMTGAQIFEIRPQFIPALKGALPILESLTKSAKDAPAVLDLANMSVPVDGNISRLNGDVKIDPGVAQFKLKSAFNDIVQLTGGKTAGTVGEKLEPFVMHFKNGVATYDRYTLPVGSFKIETRGTVDMVKRHVDVITYAPLSALTDKALGAINSGIAGKIGVLDKNTQIPIRTRGPMGDTKTEIDMGLFMKETGENLIKTPGKIIEKGLGDLLKDIGPKPKPKK